jgi:hypothetical protein
MQVLTRCVCVVVHPESALHPAYTAFLFVVIAGKGASSTPWETGRLTSQPGELDQKTGKGLVEISLVGLADGLTGFVLLSRTGLSYLFTF